MAQVWNSTTNLSATRADLFAKILTKIYNSVLSRVMGRKLLKESSFRGSFIISVMHPRHTNLQLKAFSCQLA